MGRLFWKVFFGFWLTMLAIAAVSALAVFTAQQANDSAAEYGANTDDEKPRAASGRRANNLVFRQAVVLRHGGTDALRELLHGRNLADERYQTQRRTDRDRGLNAGSGRSRSRSRGPRSGWNNDSVRVIDDTGKELFDRDIPTGTYEAARARFEQEEPADGIQQVFAPDGREYLLFIPQLGNRVPQRPTLPFYQQLSPLTLGSAGILFSMLFSGLLAWYLARPIRVLRDGFARVDSGRLDTRVSDQMGSRRDELADLGSHFDRTIERLQNLIQSQRRLLHDVSHELRSPLARMQAAVGLVRQNPTRTDQMVDRLEKETQRLDALVGEILALSRLDETSGHGEMLAIDIDNLVADIVADASFEGVEKGLKIELTGNAGVTVLGHEMLLQRAIENLVRNAVRYTRPGSVIQVAVSRADLGHVEIVVVDQGPGIAADQLDAVTEPFVRLPSAQGEAPSSGFGLGLAIAKRALQLHGGQLALSNQLTPDGHIAGLQATMRIPIRPGADTHSHAN